MAYSKDKVVIQSRDGKSTQALSSLNFSTFQLTRTKNEAYDPYVNHHDLVITVKGSGAFTLTNQTNGTSIKLNQAMGSGDTFVLNGVIPTLNGSTDVDTDFGHIELIQASSQGTVDLVFTNPSGMAQSLVRSDKLPDDLDSLGFGMNLPARPLSYVGTSNQFNIYNPSDVAIRLQNATYGANQVTVSLFIKGRNMADFRLLKAELNRVFYQRGLIRLRSSQEPYKAFWVMANPTDITPGMAQTTHNYQSI
ncbi:hypothetical protein H7R52_07030 [Weissella confusa]|uniref:Siphovirus-type tail component RIFT-related domain-containing protein n=1 Tax=Weissella confusa TaxID=1583 RepID=A0A923SMX9_WEICO|nr:hypothetical protein [Weissella confusa]